MSYVYMDNAAATRMDERVLEAMSPYLFDIYAVATSEFGYSMGIEAREALDGSREALSRMIGAETEELIFTSGGTESSNMAIKGAMMRTDRHKIVIGSLEDFPVMHSARALAAQGFTLEIVDADGDGMVDVEHLKRLIDDDTALVSIQHANQEIGTIQDVRELARLAHDAGALFHTDATHTFRRVDLTDWEVDMATISSDTIHGPKGVGALFVREGTEMGKWMDGGYQEFDLRAGPENIPGAVGFATAATLITEEENERIGRMRDRLMGRLLDEIPDTEINGHPIKRTPQNANVTFHYVEGESITLHLDMRGFAVSTGSACFSRSLESSHVIRGIGGDHERAHGSVRFTLSRFNTEEEVDSLVEALSEVIAGLREISPLSRRE